jgi:hypothetical protein
MLPLASFLLAALLGQSSLPNSDAPPLCVATQVPGCVPGYILKSNLWGVAVYVRDPNYVPPLAQNAPVPLRPVPSEIQIVASASRASWAYPVANYAPPPPPQHAPQAMQSQPKAVPPDRGNVGLVFMPGVTTFPTYTRFDQGKGSAQVALEFRGNEGGMRVRLLGEYTAFGKIGELSLKYDLLDRFFFRPFLAVGGGVASINPDPELRASGSASAGIDLYLARDFFLSAEAKRRLFMAGTKGEAHGLVVSPEKQTSFLFGMGFYLF